MALKTAYDVRCGCGTGFTAQVCEYVLADQDPELREAILSGEFNRFVCPSCGHGLFVEIPYLYRDESHRLFVWVCPHGDEPKRKKLEKELVGKKSRLERHFLDGAEPGNERLVFGREALVGLLLKEDSELRKREGAMLKRNPAIRLILEGRDDPGYLVLCGNKVRVSIPLRFSGSHADPPPGPEARKNWLRLYSSGMNIHNPFSSFLKPRIKREWDRIRDKEPLRGTMNEFDDFAASWAQAKSDPRGFKARYPERRRFIDAMKGMDVTRKMRLLRIGPPGDLGAP